MINKRAPIILGVMLAVAVVLAIGGTAAAQSAAPGVPSNDRLEQLRREVGTQELLSLRRLEGVEARMATLDHNLNRVLLIFGLLLVTALILVTNHQRAQTRLAAERINRTVREAESLIQDIHRDMLRPEMEFLRIGHFLRKIMRQFFEDKTTDNDIAQARIFGGDPNLPVSLHCMAQALVAEYEGRWHDATALLEQLRQLESEEPFVLMHLSNTHKKRAELEMGSHERQRHQQLSNQYYAQFAAVMQVKQIPPPPASRTIAPLQSEIVKPALAQLPLAPAPASVPAVRPAVSPAPPLQAVASQPLSAPVNSPKANAAVVPPATPQPITSQAAPAAPLPLPVVSKLTNGGSRPASSVSADLQNYVSGWRAVLAKGKLRNVGGVVKNSGINVLHGLQHVTQKALGNGSEANLPFLPVPAVSVPPEAASSEAETDMWRHIYQGDLALTQAGNAVNLRRRNYYIDQALARYAKAQGYQTNETLYLNWGLALLGKALHLPEKKRDPFFNAAIDKFLAGNVVAPHHFDFALASLYAIIGRAGECQRWLATSRESGNLNKESLRHAPDFDHMRSYPWFVEFLRD